MDTRKAAMTPRTLDALWDEALRRYEQDTGTKPLDSDAAKAFQGRETKFEVVLALFEQQCRSFEEFRSRGQRLLSLLKPIVHFVCIFLDAGAEAGSSMGAPGGKAIFVAFGELLKAGKGVSGLYDGIEYLFTRMASFLNRVSIYFGMSTALTLAPALSDILIQACIQVVEVLEMATKYCQSNTDANTGWFSFALRTKDYLHGLIGDSGVKKALEKLEHLTNTELLDAVAQINVIARNIQPQVQFVADAAAIAGFRNWLKPPNEQPLNWEKKRRTNSCQWFFDEMFESWRVQKNGVYWIYGKAGAGKSVLCSSIIDKLKEGPPVTLAYFYFDFSDPAKQDCLSLAASLVFQLGTCSEACQKYLQGKAKSTSPNYDELLPMLSDLVKLAGPVYIVIDALDECPEPARDKGSARFLDHLCELDSNEKDFHLLVTSRPEADIWTLFSSVTHILNYHDAEKHHEDVSSYIRSQLDRKEYHWSSDVKETIHQALEDESNGMFLWVDLQLSRLRGCISSADVERALKELPGDLHATYERILEKMDSSSAQMERVRRVFECVASAKRPLFTAEVVEIYTLDADLTSSDDMNIGDPETFILERCTGLLNISDWLYWRDNQVHRIVQFIHFSAKEFLMSPTTRDTENFAHCYRFDEYTANLALLKICLAALDVAPALPSILVYAGSYWRGPVSHQNELDLTEYLEKFLQMDSPSFARWASTLPSYDDDRDGPAIHCAAALNLSHHMKKLLAWSQSDQSPPVKSTLVTVRCPRGRTALHRAASAGMVDACRLLLDYGALVDDTDKDGDTPLHQSAQIGDWTVMRMLLEHPRADVVDLGARIHARNKHGQTALHVGAQSGEADACRLLLERGALVDDFDEDGNTPFHLSTAEGYLDIMRMLLEHPRADAAEPGARIHARNKQGRTTLHLAAHFSEAEACRLLLERGALVDDADEDGNNPLHLSARFGDLDIMRMLLEHPGADAADSGARIHARNKRGETALHLAARWGMPDACRLLLDYGALVDDADEYGNTPFHLSAQNSHSDVTRMLLDHRRADVADPGARIHARNKRGQTALHLAAWCVDVCRLLLERGALIDDADEDGNTPLHLSAQRGNLEVMRVLLEHPGAGATSPGARIHAHNKHEQTALHLAAEMGKVDACRMLLERGALVDDIDKNGNTPSHLAVGFCATSSDAIRVLLEYRAKENLGGLPRAHKLRNRLRRRAEGSEGEPWRAILEDFASQFKTVEVSLAETWFVEV